MKLFTTLRLSDRDIEDIEHFDSDLEHFDRRGVKVLFLVKDRWACTWCRCLPLHPTTHWTRWRRRIGPCWWGSTSSASRTAWAPFLATAMCWPRSLRYVKLVSLRNKSLNYVLPRLSCKFSSWMARRRPWSRQPLSAGHFNPCTFVLKFPCSGHRNVCNFCTRGEGSRNLTSQVARRESGSKWKTRHVIWVIIHDFH